MKTKKSFIIMLIVMSLVLIGGYLFIDKKVQRNILKDEISNIYKSNIMSLDYEYEIKSGFKYSSIEKYTKEFFKKHNKLYVDSYKLVNSDKNKKLLSIDNYKSDPKLDNSIKYLEDSKKDINNKLDKIINESSIKQFMKYMDNKKLSRYYSSLSDKLLNTNDMKKYLKSNKKSIEESRNSFNNVLDSELKVLKLLKDNSDKWDVGEKGLEFKNQSLYDEYNKLISEIK